MKEEHLLFFGVAGFFAALILFIVIIYKPPTLYVSSTADKGAVSSEKDVGASLNSRIKALEGEVALLATAQNSQVTALQEVREYMATATARPAVTPSLNSIVAVASTKGGVFTTSSAVYAPMGMYVNIRCPKNCYLWIGFYSSSQNTGQPASQEGFANTYGIFLNDADQGIFAQANIPTASSSIPASLNAVIPVGAGVYTIDVRAKANGGTLQSNASSLQVMAIDR